MITLKEYKIIPDKMETRFKPIQTKSGIFISADVDYKLYCKLPKYAQDNDDRKVDVLDVTKTVDGNHYVIHYDDDTSFEEYGWSNFLYCIKTNTQY